MSGNPVRIFDAIISYTTNHVTGGFTTTAMTARYVPMM